MGLSSELTRGMLNYALRGVPFTAPGALYVGLHTGDPEDGAPELSGEFYARRPVTFDEKGGVLQSTNPIEFPSLSPSKVPVSHYAVYDAPDRGRRVFSERFTDEPRRLTGGETIRIPSEGITVL
jgi:hypothetical protein